MELSGLYILSIALLLDALIGEASNAWHPVAWLGKLISLELKLEPPEGPRRQLLFGAVMVVMTCIAIAVPLWLGLTFLLSLNPVIYILVSAYLFKNTFALKGLWKAVEDVRLCLQRNDAAQARRKAKSLVSRDTSGLSDEQLMSAAVESCAENLCDSFVAPLFYFAILGLPGALIYRIVNTFDAMIGYHGRWEYTGKAAARLDDALNYIPARLSALLIVVASGICRADAGGSWRTMQKQHGRTSSPNAGWTMCSMAGSLGIELEKSGEYTLNGGGAALSNAVVSRSQAVMLTSAGIWGLMIAVVEALVGIAR
ncbi:MAG: cobalamin biosynthesis protein [Dehalococcoidia bacterium]|jgi:adenosylcobinamide-phosphate synthase